MEKESLSLQNHIVWSCFIFITQKCSHQAQPRWQAKQLFHTFYVLKLFQPSGNTWAWAMDIALYVEYDGGCGEDKKEKIISHQLGVSTGYGDAHQ